MNYLNYLLRSIVLFSLFLTSCEKEPEPIADFMMSKTTAETGESITFTNMSDNAGSYSWDFGDGNTSIANSPTHAYISVGTYTVKLTAKGDGGENFTTKTITIIHPAPIAGFTMDKTNAGTGEMITFTNTSLNASSYSWDFGDGSTSTDVNPSHYYSSKGIYKVILTATGEGGQHSTSKEITITFKLPETKFSGTNAHGRQIKFTVESGIIKDFETQFILRISETQYMLVTTWRPMLGSITYTTENNFEVHNSKKEKVLYGSYSDNEIDGIYMTDYGPLDFVASHSNKKSPISLNPVAEWFTNYQDINEFTKNMESLRARYNQQISFELLE